MNWRYGLSSSGENSNVKTKGIKDLYIVMKAPSLFRTKGAQMEFLVLWKGWPVEDASWVNQRDVTPYLLKYELYHILCMLNMIILLLGHLVPLNHHPA